MLKILQARLQQYVTRELPDVQAGFRKGRGTRDKIASISWIIEKAREFQKNIYFCFIDYAKAFDCVDHNKLWKKLQYSTSESTVVQYNSWHTGAGIKWTRQEELPMEEGEEVGDGRAEGSSAIGDRGRPGMSLTPDMNGTYVCISES